jgi:hypothetical protein
MLVSPIRFDWHSAAQDTALKIGVYYICFNKLINLGCSADLG